ncbi:hypothetical protein AZI87_04690 [Bdellovibrio bacteriovorus]|uniref:CidA/LrgA family protein n=1 Tax=Bdellovibrio bacteriovorus TaxID=959 RepID=A0A161PE16_BDEBC|nr:CidA/LrgA family protein [Bdellovibrio bacteriovorus]KYG68544.1 hypothetical protein AZI87_04690 [Bdellovibrio bacteriovorus]
MILALLILLTFQFLGEGTVALLNLFIPGPVLGMVYFFIALVLWPPLKEKVEALSRFMNAHLALFFVPAGVGIIDYFDLFGRYGWAMAITLIVSTLITLGVTAWFFNLLLKMHPEQEPKHD